MRTAIYVFKPSLVTFRPYDERDREPMLFRYQKAPQARVAAGQTQLQPGIYLIKSYGPLQIDAPAGVTVETTTDDKDIWPVPKATALALEPGATLEEVQEFFLITKGVGD